MKKVLSLMAVAGIVAGFAAPAHADEFVARYTYMVNGASLPATTATITQPAVISDSCSTKVITEPAIVDSCATKVISQPAVVDACGTAVITQPAVLAKPVMIEHRENLVPHLFHLGLWPLVDFSIF